MWGEGGSLRWLGKSDCGPRLCEAGVLYILASSSESENLQLLIMYR